MTQALEGKLSKNELITFSVDDQYFCMDIMRVREIRGWTKATILPHAESFVLGVINLRGAVVPIVDLAARLGLPPLVPEARHVVLVTHIGERVVGFLVSAVSDILSVDPRDVQEVPKLSDANSHDFVEGIIVSDGRMLSILDAAAAAPMEVENDGLV